MRQHYSIVKQAAASMQYTHTRTLSLSLAHTSKTQNVGKSSNAQTSTTDSMRDTRFTCTLQTNTLAQKKEKKTTNCERERERISDAQWENICCICADWGLVKHRTVNNSSSYDVSVSSVHRNFFGKTA